MSNVWEFLADMVVNIVKNSDICYGFIFSGHTGTAMLLGSIYVFYSPFLATRILGVIMVCYALIYKYIHYTTVKFEFKRSSDENS